MNKILVDIRDENDTIKLHFDNQDFVSVDDLLNKIDELSYTIDNIKDEYEDFKQNVRDNYKQIPISEQVQVYDKDFY